MENLKEKADEYYKKKQWEEARKAYKQIVDKGYKKIHIDVYARLAIVQRFLKDYEGSEKTLKLGIEKFPDSIGLIIEYAALENVRKNWKEAVSLWKRAKSKSKNFSVLNYNRYARALEGDNDSLNLIELINEALKIYPLNEELNKFKDKTIIRKKNNISTSLVYASRIKELKILWNWEGVKKAYIESFKSNNKMVMEYMIYLADIGELDVLYDFINSYSFKYFEDLILDNSFVYSKKHVIQHILSIYKDEYILALSNTLINRSIELNLIYLSTQNDLLPLQNYLLKNDNIFKKDNGKSQMILNFSINKLIEQKLFTSSMALKIIDLYTESNSINKQRKIFLLSKIIDYFDKNGDEDFFTYLKFKGGYIQKLASTIHRYGDNEEGAKNYLRKLHSLVKFYSVDYKIDKKSPRVAICISGMIRGDAKSVFKLLEKNIKQPLNADVFIHTWSERHEWMGIGGDINWVYRQFGNKVLNNCPEELKLKPFMEKNFPNIFLKLEKAESKPVDKKYLKKLIDFTDYSIENQEDFLKNVLYQDESFKSRGHFNQVKMFYGIYKATEMMKEYERKNNIEYDYIIRCRPDIGLNNALPIEKLNQLEKDEILVDFYPYGPQDQFRAGCREPMLILSNIWKEMLKHKALSPFVEYPKIDAHNLIYLWMIENSLITVPTNVKRDVSLASRGANMPSISKELELDLKNIDNQYKNREDFEKFFKLLMEL